MKLTLPNKLTRLDAHWEMLAITAVCSCWSRYLSILSRLVGRIFSFHERSRIRTIQEDRAAFPSQPEVILAVSSRRYFFTALPGSNPKTHAADQRDRRGERGQSLAEDRKVFRTRWPARFWSRLADREDANRAMSWVFLKTRTRRKPIKAHRANHARSSMNSDFSDSHRRSALCRGDDPAQFGPRFLVLQSHCGCLVWPDHGCHVPVSSVFLGMLATCTAPSC